jgi:type III secretory pathway component EscU
VALFVITFTYLVVVAAAAAAMVLVAVAVALVVVVAVQLVTFSVRDFQFYTFLQGKNFLPPVQVLHLQS